MVVKVYISGISGNKEVKKRQQRVLMILDSKNIKYDIIDITEPGKEADKDFMQNNSKSNGGTVSDPNPRSPLPPQLFNDEKYCGDYEQFDLANEVDTLEQFLKLEMPPEEPTQVDSEKERAINGDLDGENDNKQENLDVKEDTETAEQTEESTNEKEKSPVKEDLEKEQSPTKEGSSVQNPNNDEKEDAKEKSLVQDVEDRQSVEKEGTPKKAQSPEKELEKKLTSKENTPENENAINENGTVSSREQSEEKAIPEDEQTDAVDLKTDNASEVLIQSEQAAAAE